jgi:hypothetical protein
MQALCNMLSHLGRTSTSRRPREPPGISRTGRRRHRRQYLILLHHRQQEAVAPPPCTARPVCSPAAGRRTCGGAGGRWPRRSR